MPSRESFGLVIVNAFQVVAGVEVLHWVVSQENHSGASGDQSNSHYHIALKLKKRARWSRVRQHIQNNHEEFILVQITIHITVPINMLQKSPTPIYLTHHVLKGHSALLKQEGRLEKVKVSIHLNKGTQHMMLSTSFKRQR